MKIHPTIGVLVCLGSGERQRCTHTHTHTCVQQGKEMALRNADFKLLLGKAAAGGSSQQTASQGPEAAGPSSRGHQATAAPGVSMGPPGALPSKPGDKKKQRRERKSEFYKKKFQHSKERAQSEKEKSKEPKYRDRAKERQLGINPEEEALGRELGANYQAAFKDLTEEELQYLGGSETTTHLVKGLDYKLLEKVRQEQAKAENEALEAALNEQVEGPAKMELAAAAAGADPSKEASKTLQNLGIVDVTEIRHETRTGKQIHAAMIRHLSMLKCNFPRNTERFLPRRTSYIFELGLDTRQGIPIILQRSKMDCPTTKDRIVSPVSADIIKQVEELQDNLRTGRRRKKKVGRDMKRMIAANKPEVRMSAIEVQPESSGQGTSPHANRKQQQQAMIAPLTEDEDDIFGDVDGDYDPLASYQKEKSSVPAPPSSTPGHGKISYFGSEGEALENGSPGTRDSSAQLHEFLKKHQSASHPVVSKVPAGEGAGTPEKQGNDRSRTAFDNRPKDGVNMFVNEGEDSYTECYPEALELEHQVVDSDEEPDYSKMDSIRKKPVRQHFSSQEEYEMYKSNQEAVPSAAFQFGRKMADGRKTRRSAKHSVDTEWKQIEGMIRKREASSLDKMDERATKRSKNG